MEACKAKRCPATGPTCPSEHPPVTDDRFLATNSTRPHTSLPISPPQTGQKLASRWVMQRKLQAGGLPTPSRAQGSRATDLSAARRSEGERRYRTTLVPVGVPCRCRLFERCFSHALQRCTDPVIRSRSAQKTRNRRASGARSLSKSNASRPRCSRDPTERTRSNTGEASRVSSRRAPIALRISAS